MPRRPATDLTGQVFDRLTVLSRASTSVVKHILWNCECVCSTRLVVRGDNLIGGNSKSCGCMKMELARSNQRSLKHGQSFSPTYASWRAMLKRTTNPNATNFYLYGAQGVTVCDRWNPKKGGSFENFLADLGERPEGTSLGRFGDAGNYEPGNVAWQTPKEQGATRTQKHLQKMQIKELAA
jgi:hypothetical protein